MPGRPHRGGLQRPADPLAGARGRSRSGGCRGGHHPAGALAPARGGGAGGRAGPRRGLAAGAAPVKEPAELERVAAACAVADAALAALLPTIRIGQYRGELALDLEWAMRTSGAEALAFDVACLSGPRAALPHGSPGERRVARRRGAPVRFRRAGLRLPLGHDANAVRRVTRRRDLASTSWWLAPQEAAFDALGAAAAVASHRAARHRCRRARRHRGGRPRRALRARPGPRHRPGDARRAVAGHAAAPDGRCRHRRCSGRAGRLPGRRDRRAHRGPRLVRPAARPMRAAHPLPARGDRRRRLTPARLRYTPGVVPLAAAGPESPAPIIARRPGHRGPSGTRGSTPHP